MKRILALAAVLLIAGPILARGPDFRGPAGGNGGPSPLPAVPKAAYPREAGSTTQEVKKQYTCPMHPEVQQDHPRNCPKCGMTLVLKTPAKLLSPLASSILYARNA